MIPLHKVRMAPEATDRVGEVLASGYVSEGPWVRELEDMLADSTDAHVTTLNSCTSAIQLAAHLCGAWDGESVITTPMTCLATSTALAAGGAHLLWADVDPDTGNICPDSVYDLLQLHDVAAICGVDWGGRPCNWSELRYAPLIPIIRDAAHSWIDTYDPSVDYTCYSFQAIKFLTTGDGGALVTPEPNDRARLLRWFGLDRNLDRCTQNVDEAGWKYHMNDIAAAIGIANLPGAWNSRVEHRWRAWRLWTALADCPHVRLPPYDAESSYWIFTLLANSQHERDGLIKHLRANGIEAGRVHSRTDRHSCFEWMGGAHRSGVAYFDDHQFNVPCGWWLTEDDLNHIVGTIRGYRG